MGKDAAAADFHPGRQIYPVNNGLGGAADRLSVDGGDGAGNGGGTIAVKAADRYRPLFNGNGADGTQLDQAQRPLHGQVFQAVDVVHRLRPAAHHYIHSDVLQVNIGHILPVDKAVQLLGHFGGGKAVLGRPLRVNADGYFIPGVADIAAEVDNAVQGGQGRLQLPGHGDNIAELGSGNGYFQVLPGRPGRLGSKDIFHALRRFGQPLPHLLGNIPGRAVPHFGGKSGAGGGPVHRNLIHLQRPAAVAESFQSFLNPPGVDKGLTDSAARRQFGGDGQGFGGSRREKGDGNDPQQGQAAAGNDQGGQQRRQLVGNGPSQDRRIEFLQPDFPLHIGIVRPGAGQIALPQQDNAQHRNGGQGHDGRGQQRKAHRQGKGGKELANHAADESQGDEHDHSR